MTDFLMALCTSAYPTPERDEDEDREWKQLTDDIANEPAPLCDYCGEESEYLVEVEDSDPSVGYRDSMNICPKCQTLLRIQRNRGY